MKTASRLPARTLRAVLAAATMVVTLVPPTNAATSVIGATSSGLTSPIVDTGQHRIYSSSGQLFKIPRPDGAYYGQDGQYAGNQPHYRDNGDGTVTDLVTGLMWQKNVDYDHPMTYDEAKAAVRKFNLGGYHDWRIPTIKQLYSLINYQGHMMRGSGSVPFIDTHYFNFEYGQASRGERKIDTQIMSSTVYVGTTMHNSPTQFGVNFADGRIKGYPLGHLPNGRIVRKYYRFVRGNPQYGHNHFVDNGDGTVSDLATGLMWAKADSAKPMNWEQALAYCRKLNLAGHHDWRLPNAKELQSIVDYRRAPDAVNPAQRGPAIDPVFSVTDPQGWAWTSTTHLDGPRVGTRAVYIAFGEATGYLRNPFSGSRQLLDVHGAGAQRSDPKAGDPNSPRWAHGFGPQGDVIRIENYVRPVRNINPNAVKVVQPDMTPVPNSGADSGFEGNRGYGNGPGSGSGAPGGRFGPSQNGGRGGFRRPPPFGGGFGAGAGGGMRPPPQNFSPQTSVTGPYRSASVQPDSSRGLVLNKAGAFDGYTLFAPLSSTTTYLIDNQGRVVHTWRSSFRPGMSARLLPDGDLMRAGRLPPREETGFRAGGAGGVVEEWNWNGDLMWRYRCAGADYLQNHDVAVLPDGDLLVIIWQRENRTEAVAAGRNPTTLRDGDLWPDSVIEVKPIGKTGGRIVWRWNLWDHLIQDFDPSKANYGNVASHPGRLDINCLALHGPASHGGADWTHANSIAYNPKLDQILLSFRNTGEIYIIDHSTTTAQAAGHRGGRYGKGGDFLYRWGNPANYGAGGRADEKLFGQHDAGWIPSGLPGAGHILVFNNNAGVAVHRNYSEVLELAPPVDAKGHYHSTVAGAFSPATVVWRFRAHEPDQFYSSHLGSAQRLPNGDTLIDSGVTGTIFEVTAAGKVVWEYKNPHGNRGRYSLFDAFRYAPDYAGLRRL